VTPPAASRDLRERKIPRSETVGKCYPRTSPIPRYQRHTTVFCGILVVKTDLSAPVDALVSRSDTVLDLRGSVEASGTPAAQLALAREDLGTDHSPHIHMRDVVG